VHALERLQHLEAVQLRQSEVEQYAIEPASCDALDRLATVDRAGYYVSFGAQQLLECDANRAIVVDHEYVRHVESAWCEWRCTAL